MYTASLWRVHGVKIHCAKKTHFYTYFSLFRDFPDRPLLRGKVGVLLPARINRRRVQLSMFGDPREISTSSMCAVPERTWDVSFDDCDVIRWREWSVSERCAVQLAVGAACGMILVIITVSRSMPAVTLPSLLFVLSHYCSLLPLRTLLLHTLLTPIRSLAINLSAANLA